MALTIKNTVDAMSDLQIGIEYVRVMMHKSSHGAKGRKLIIERWEKIKAEPDFEEPILTTFPNETT